MNSSSRNRKTACNLSESTQRCLNSYALAATAAGVGVLALALPAEAKIVYTAAHHVIKQGTKRVLALVIMSNFDQIGKLLCVILLLFQ
jgi:hypothetical protein